MFNKLDELLRQISHAYRLILTFSTSNVPINPTPYRIYFTDRFQILGKCKNIGWV